MEPVPQVQQQQIGDSGPNLQNPGSFAQQQQPTNLKDKASEDLAEQPIAVAQQQQPVPTEALLQNGHVNQDQQGGDGQNQSDQSSISRRILLEDEKRRLMYMQAAQQRSAMMMPASQYGMPPPGFAMAPAQAMQLQAMNARFMIPQSFNGMQMNPQMFFPVPPGSQQQQQQQGAMQSAQMMMPQMMMAPPHMMMAPNQAMMMQGQFDPTMGGFFAPSMAQAVHLANPEGVKDAEDDGKKSPAPDMPIRPLSAYNFFFSDERERVLLEEKGEDIPEEAVGNKKKRLLNQHLLKDRTKRRPHRKTHGTIGFTSLSKLIGKRWRELPEEKKQYYREIATLDMDRYQRSVAEYNNDRLNKKVKR